MSTSVKGKQLPGSARSRVARLDDLQASTLTEFRKVDPHKFVRKLLLIAFLLVIFGVGVVNTQQSVKQICASLITLPPLICGAEALMKGRSRLKGLTRFLAFEIAALILLWMAVTAPTLVSQFCIGAMFAHGTELAHQALHKKGTGRLACDTPIGLVLCGATLVSFFSYQWTHLRHHKYNGTEKDRESFDYAYGLIDSPSGAWRLLGFVLHLTLAGHYVTAAKRIALAVIGRLRDRLLAAHPDMTPKVAVNVQREYQCHALLLLAAVVATAAFQTTLLVDLWLIPMLVGWGPAHSLIETTEHWHCDVPNPNVFRNTRSIKAGLFACWYTNFNNCHVGHHHDMSVPADKLPEFETALAGANEFGHWEESYPAFYARFLRHLWVGPSVAAPVATDPSAA